MQTPRLVLAMLAAGALIVQGGCAERREEPVFIEVRGPDIDRELDDTIRVATANLWGVVAGGIDWASNIDARFMEFAERLSQNPHQLDVVLIQEAWKRLPRRALLAHPGVIREFPYAVDAVERPGGSGLVILSRFPIESASFYRFRAQGNCMKFWEGDCLGGKGLLAAKLRIGSRALWVGNTHLIACYPGKGAPETACDDRDPNGQPRWQQLLELRRTMEGLAGDDTAILGGDLNFTRTSRYYKAITSAAIPQGSTDSPKPFAAGAPQRGWHEAGDEFGAPGRIDYVWTRDGLESRWHAGDGVRQIYGTPVFLYDGTSVPLSDHAVLMSTLCLTRVDDPANECMPLRAPTEPSG